MSRTIVEHEGFAVVGIAGRTNNAREATADALIPQLWQRFLAQGLLAQIPYRASEDVYAVYTDYAGDVHDEYTVLIGARVTATENTPRGMTARTVRAGQYAKFTSNSGRPEKVVPETWQAVWADSELVRAYLTDFEQYDARGQNPEAAIVDLYIGIK